MKDKGIEKRKRSTFKSEGSVIQKEVNKCHYILGPYVHGKTKWVHKNHRSHPKRCIIEDYKQGRWPLKKVVLIGISNRGTK